MIYDTGTTYWNINVHKEKISTKVWQFNVVHLPGYVCAGMCVYVYGQKVSNIIPFGKKKKKKETMSTAILIPAFQFLLEYYKEPVCS